ncbi:MAG: bifunctional (p)ppGpp synthetase/guanosine-3',5'-bis(diphosphate) 3'-pyrophosphohydrolase, partial [Pseudomonadales bacterium]|nr:bifunctional (p)ppGpp synthetase/guanosine-3',5'-bis(diphosphate) 3'-pyrophosphohydrolase [Pseudomonadales bacterium]
MVTVRKDQPLLDDGRINIDAWLDRLSLKTPLAEDEKRHLRKACYLAEKLEQQAIAQNDIWSEGSSSFGTGLEMAEILAELNVDAASLIAAVLYRSVREGKLPLEAVVTDFGESVAGLVQGVLRMAVIGAVQPSNNNVLGQSIHDQVDNLRKMLISIIDDVRLPLIKLAERTCAMRAVKNSSYEKQQRVAREVFDIYAPLAHRLGIGHIKWELEDLSFRYLEPDVYKQIAKLLDGKRVDRQFFVEDVIKLLQELLRKEGVNAEITGRAKHIYSIWRKMRQKDIGFSQVYDIRAVRILVDTVAECYSVLGIVHSQWRNIPNEFDDYIASPKDNGYRSLHTAVIGPERKVLEVQIRTREMHEEAEFGVCAHWQYKGEKGINRNYEQKVEWLRQVLAWHEETGGDKALIEELSADVDQERVYVFTPEGHVIELPDGSTPLDFAYHIHTEVGHRCRGARVNGKIVPLNYILKTSDQVEILMGKHEIPSRDWLLPALGYT